VKVAVVGGGIAGLSAAYYLRRCADVTLFEKGARLGGNAWTWRSPAGHRVDIAVAAFGRAGYRRFYALLRQLRVPTSACATSYMSFHDLDGGRGLYVTPTPEGLLAQRFDLLHPDRLRIAADLLLGLRDLQSLRKAGALRGSTVAEALDRVPRLSGEARLVFLCALSLLSSMDLPGVLAAPAEFFLAKLATHGDVLSPRAVWSVRCVRDGTEAYVRALAERIRCVVLGARLRTVERSARGVVLHHEDGRHEAFDAAVLACNADQALALLAEPTPDERELLGAWRYEDGRIVVHRDLSSFPRRPLVQAYTFLHSRRGGALRTSVNGALWHEPQAGRDCPLVSTQHANFPIRHDRIELEAVLRTPIFDFRSCDTIGRLPSLNGVRRTWYCGSHFGFGLHEDAVASAWRAAEGVRAAFARERSV